MLGTLRSKVSYASKEIRKHYDKPDWWHGRVQARIAGPITGIVYEPNGINVMREDWDNLLVLDACRADMFEETIGTDQFDDYRRVWSKGSSSPEWMRKNFQGKSFGDTVYFTANPWISKIAPDAFHDIVNVWLMESGVEEAELKETVTLRDLGVPPGTTITPDTLNNVIVEMADEYPNKRYLIHYFQPHAPCIGLPDGKRKPDDEVNIDLHPGNTLKHGIVERDEVWNAYEDNLEYVFHHANELAETIGGRSVFTADHGELFGEWLWPVPIRGYAHPARVRHPALARVPWAVKQVGDRRRIVEGDTTRHEADENEIDERLRDLGYKV